MLADDVAVDVGDVHAEASGDDLPEPSRVEHRARPEDARGRDAALGRVALGDAGHQIHRVRRDDDHRVGRVPDDVGEDRRDHLRVPPREVEPRLAGPLRRTGGDHDHGGAVERVRAAGGDPHRGRERRDVRDVGRLRGGLLRVDVHQHDLARHATQGEGVRRRRADEPRPDDPDLHERHRRHRRARTAMTAPSGADGGSPGSRGPVGGERRPVRDLTGRAPARPKQNLPIRRNV